MVKTKSKARKAVQKRTRKSPKKPTRSRPIVGPKAVVGGRNGKARCGSKTVVGPRIVYADYIGWRPHFSEPGHESFDPTQVPNESIPYSITEYYEDKAREVESVMCYPGPRRQMYGRALKPLVYLIIRTTDERTDCWAKLPHPSLRGEESYWQIDRNIRLSKGWQW